MMKHNQNDNKLTGWEAHGFRTMEELDVKNIMEEAKARWLRPNEIHAMLCNYNYFTINVKPVNLPKSGTIVLFDRKTLRNFRKDGHNWKKKNDKKTVKEAHEHLKVGNEERIHVYYAHGEDNPTFVRRCYWLLDKEWSPLLETYAYLWLCAEFSHFLRARENIVLVHYRETQELQSSPVTPLSSNSSSALSNLPSWILSDEADYGTTQTFEKAEKAHSGTGNLYSSELGNNTNLETHGTRLHEINTLEWEELVVPDDPYKLSPLDGGKGSCLLQQNQCETNRYTSSGNISSTNQLWKENILGNFSEPNLRTNSNSFSFPDNACFEKMDSQTTTDLLKIDSQSQMAGNGFHFLDVMGKDTLQSQDSFDMWMNCVMDDFPVSLEDSVMQNSSAVSPDLSTSSATNHLQSPVPGQIFSITDISPAWAFSTEATKILITGYFEEGDQHQANSDIYCVCGDVHIRLETVQSGVYRCFVSPHASGLVEFYLSFDRHTPISQVLTFEYRVPLMSNLKPSEEDKSNWEELRVQTRLVQLLFSNSERLCVMPSTLAENIVNEAKTFASRTSHIAAHWADMLQSIETDKTSYQRAKGQLFELSLMNRLCEWLVERILEGSKTSDRDDLGQGVIHLCAILGYRWAVYPYASAGLSLDYRDKFGWTALHWAAYYGREKMAAALLSAGAKPYLVTDPTSQNLGGCTVADLASKNGHDGLAAFLAEKALLNHFSDMTIAGNVSGSLQTNVPHSLSLANVDEEELCLKDSLTAYRTAADAAARIQAAFREQSFKLRTKEVRFSSAEDEARGIVAAMKIQHAFRDYGSRKQMVAAAQIQHRFRTWKTRREFLRLRRNTVKIQAHFRGFQVRKHYRKVLWSVGVLEKAILRWRMKRKGFRGLNICSAEAVRDQDQDSVVEETFFRASRKQAEERIERSVVRVQAIFRSKRAQQEYRRMKLSVDQARLEYEGLVTPEIDMR